MWERREEREGRREDKEMVTSSLLWGPLHSLRTRPRPPRGPFVPRHLVCSFGLDAEVGVFLGDLYLVHELRLSNVEVIC